MTVQPRNDAPQRTGWSSILLFFLVFLLYLPTIAFGFVSWDDPAYVYENEAVTSPDGLAEIWTSTQMPKGATNWPLVFTTFWLEYRISGGHPYLFHLNNALLHALASSLAFWMLLQLGADRRAAFLTALLFGVHPIQVESVAWITERKNVLSAVFFFASMGMYFRYRQLGNPWRYGWAIVYFALALLSKSTVVALPLLWVLADRFVFDNKWSLASLRRAAIPVALAVLSALSTLQADVVSSRNLPLEKRPFVIAANIWFYFGKMLYPAEFAPVYPRWDVNLAEPVWWVSLLSLVAVLCVCWYYRERLDPISFWAGCYYLLMLLPVSGIKPFGYMSYTFNADHFVYLPALGVFLILTRCLRLLEAEKFERLQRPVKIAIAVAICSLMFKTLTLLPVWRDSESLWEYAKEVSPASAHDVLATGAFRTENYEKAAEHLREVVAHRPHDVYALTSLGQCLFRSGNRRQGLEYLKKAVEIAPDDFDSQFNLAKAYIALADFSKAIPHLEKAQQLIPEVPAVGVELGFAYARLGRLGEAQQLFESLLRRFPASYYAHLGLAHVQASQGKNSVAMETLKRLTEQYPEKAEAWREWANLAAKQRRAEEALEILSCAEQSVEESTSIRWLRLNLLIDDDHPQINDPKQALQLAEELLRDATPLSVAQLDSLSRVYAANGDWSSAIRYAQRALNQAKGTLKERIGKRIEQYRQNLSASQ